MKKILFITAFPPNSKSGGQVLSLDLLKDLSKLYIIDLVYFNYRNHNLDESICVNSIKSFDISNWNSFRMCGMHPIFTRRFNRNILQYFAAIASNYDILFFDYTQVGIYSMHIHHSYKVIRCHDVMIQKFSRKNKIFRTWVKRTEREILENVHKIFVPTRKDVYIIKDEYNLTALFSHERIKDFVFCDFHQANNVFSFFGLWSRPENLDGLVWFIKKVLPLLRKDLDIRFLVIGGGLSEKVRKKYILPHKNIEYLGFVSNPLDFIYKSCALIAPLFTGAGVKIKVIDAFTVGTPVIGTTEITFEGLPYVEDLTFYADTAEEYGEVINTFYALNFVQKQKNADIFKSLYEKQHLFEQL